MKNTVSSLDSHIDLLERTTILPVQLSQVITSEADLQVLEGLKQFLFSCFIHF